MLTLGVLSTYNIAFTEGTFRRLIKEKFLIGVYFVLCTDVFKKICITK